MKTYFDFEFIETGYENPLIPISVGMIREDGATYYAIFNPIPWNLANDWVVTNIGPVIAQEIHENPDIVKNRFQIRNEIVQFVGEKPEFWGYFCSYDWVLMAQLMGRMIDLPGHWPMHPMDLKQEMVRLDIKRSELDFIKNEQQHHALADAVWNRSVHQYLIERTKNEAL